jgi:hypothetical protein
MLLSEAEFFCEGISETDNAKPRSWAALALSPMHL